MLHERIKEIINKRVGIDPAIREALYEEIIREVKAAQMPQGRREGVTIMTPDASRASDDRDNEDPGQPVPKSF